MILSQFRLMQCVGFIRHIRWAGSGAWLEKVHWNVARAPIRSAGTGKLEKTSCAAIVFVLVAFS
jgi:hypothetical protein